MTVGTRLRWCLSGLKNEKKDRATSTLSRLFEGETQDRSIIPIEVIDVIVRESLHRLLHGLERLQSL
jgi:hypothetical protein